MGAKLIINNIYSQFVGLGILHIEEVRKILTIDTSGVINGWHFNRKKNKSEFGPHFEKSQWSAFEPSSSSFPTGFLWMIIGCLPSDIEIEDRRDNIVSAVSSPEEACASLGIEVRDYQLDTVRHVLKSQRGIVKVATNGGKTEIMAMLLLCYERACTIIIAPSLTGLTEICERFDLRGIPYTIIDSGHKEPDYEGVNVCSLDSLVRLEEFDKLLRTAKILMWDECDDSSTASQGSEIGMKCNAYVRVYLSGTPFTDDRVQNLKLIGITGNVIVDIPNRYLIEKEYSAKPTVVFHASHPVPISSQKLSFMIAKKLFINENEIFAQRIIEEVSKHVGQGIVVIYQEKKHGKLLAQKASEHGLRFVNIHGDSGHSERESAKEKLRIGVIDVIFASSIWNRALDYSFPTHWFYVAGFKASNIILQRWGRALRKKKSGENRVWIHEWFILGDTNLIKHSRHRLTVARSEGFDVEFADSFLQSYV